MPYIKDTIISRPPMGATSIEQPRGAQRHYGLGGLLDSIGDVAKGALTFYGQQQQQAGAISAMQNQQPVVQQSSGISTTTVVVAGVAVVGLVFLLTKKR